jgi:hypothetical protein
MPNKLVYDDLATSTLRRKEYFIYSGTREIADLIKPYLEE